MPSLQHVRTSVIAADLEMSHITDLAIRSVGAGAARQDIVYATTRIDGAITAWSLAGTGLTRIDTAAHGGRDTAGAVAGLGFLPSTAGTGLLAGGGVSGALTWRLIGADGQLGAAQVLGGLTGIRGDMVDMETVTLDSGRSFVFGGIAGNSGIVCASFGAAGGLTGLSVISDTATTHADQVTALTQAQVGGVTYLLGASTLSPGISSWAINSTGGLTASASLNADNGLWISAPTALETATINGQTYLILAAAGTGSISVIELGLGGAMAMRAHLLDDRDSRFAGVTALSVIDHGAMTYVVAGGSDDGISVFALLPGGQLVAVAHLADTTTMTLANISAITARSTGTGIDIFVASSTEAGLTRLRLETGAAGVSQVAAATGTSLTGGAGADVLRGAAGNDRINGAAGDDILTDGAGTDTLSGGAGADIFVLDYDQSQDVITDFTPGQDKLNLATWPMLRSLYQLTMTQTADGLQINYGDEVLIIRSAAGTPINPAQFDSDDLIGGISLPVIPTPGFPGPPRPPPPLPPRPVIIIPDPVDPVDPNPEPEPWPFPPTDPPDEGSPDPPPDPDPPDSDPTPLNVIRGTARAEQLRGTGGADLITGLAGNDRIDGGGDNDRLSGGAGKDVLLGRSGNDVLLGKGGQDILRGGSGLDHLVGGGGSDRLLGQRGDDTLSGGGGVDVLRGGGGNDSLTDGGGADQLFGNGGNDRLAGGSGNDRLHGGAGADVFVFSAGRDVIADFQGSDRIALDDTLWPGTLSVAAILNRHGDVTDAGVMLDFGSGDRLLLAGIDDLDLLRGRIDLI